MIIVLNRTTAFRQQVLLLIPLITPCLYGRQVEMYAMQSRLCLRLRRRNIPCILPLSGAGKYQGKVFIPLAL